MFRQKVYQCVGLNRWTYQGEPVENRLLIDLLEYVYDYCYARYQFKVDVVNPDRALTIGETVWSADAGIVTASWTVPLRFDTLPKMPELEALVDSLNKFSRVLGIPAELLKDFDSSFRVGFEQAARSFWGNSFYNYNAEPPSEETIRLLAWLASPWRTSEDLSWLSPDGKSDYPQRYKP